MLGSVRDWATKAAADALRLAFAPWLERRCRRCLVSGVNNPLEHGLCGACRHPSNQFVERNPARAAARLRSAILEAVGTPARSAVGHDAIVLNSGGKDSLYMLTRLRREFPRLRFLSVTFDNGFLNRLSVGNIQAVCEREGVDSLIVRPDPKLYRALIDKGMRESGEVGCYRVDSMDGAIFRDLASRLAVERGIRLVLCGHTCAQTRTILGFDDFRMPPHLLAKDRGDYFGIPVQDVFGSDHAHVWKGSEVAAEDIPSWLFPLQAWRPSQMEIERHLKDAGFSPARVKQYLTGNALQAVFMLHDYCRLRRFSYEPEVAIMLREGLVDRREWRRIYAMIEIASRSRRLTRALAAPPLRKLGLDFEALFPEPARRPRRSHLSPGPAAPDPRAGAPR